MRRKYFTFKLVHGQSWDIFRMATNWDIFRRANSDMGMGPYSRERTWQLRTWSTGCSAHCGLQCLYQLRPPLLGKTAASRAGLKKTFALQLRMNHGKRQRCSLYFSLCEKLKKIMRTSKVTNAHWRASIKWYIKPPGMLSWWHLSKQKFIDRLSTRYPREKSWGSLDEIRPGPLGFENMKGWKMKDEIYSEVYENISTKGQGGWKESLETHRNPVS